MESDNRQAAPRTKRSPGHEKQPRERKSLGIVALGVAFVLCGTLADAQQQAKIAKIGWLAVRPASAAFVIESFQREFRKLGYVDGQEHSFRVSIR